MKTNLQIEALTSAVEKTDRMIKISDAREYFGGCIPGWQVFAAKFGFSWRTTLKVGIPASTLLKTEDVMAYNLVTYVYKREGLL
jgi:hypothetical protein